MPGFLASSGAEKWEYTSPLLRARNSSGAAYSQAIAGEEQRNSKSPFAEFLRVMAYVGGGLLDRTLSRAEFLKKPVKKILDCF